MNLHSMITAVQSGQKEYCKFERRRLDCLACHCKAAALLEGFGGSTAFYQNSLEEEKVPTGTCPECDADVHVDMDTDKGELVSCEECGTELEIVGLDPVELDIVEEGSFDDDEDEDEY